MLTWAIDPALLSDVSVMSRPYRVSGTGSCSAGRREQASSAATTWLAGVQKVAAQQDFFTTPYADVDVAALAHGGLDSELAAAFADGRLAAAQTEGPRHADQDPRGSRNGSRRPRSARLPGPRAGSRTTACWSGWPATRSRP